MFTKFGEILLDLFPKKIGRSCGEIVAKVFLLVRKQTKKDLRT